MLQISYLYRNLTRNPMRTALTCAAVAFPIIIYVLSAAVIDGLNQFLDNSAKQLRIVVTHKTSIVNPLPAAYVSKIQSLDPTKSRIVAVCGILWVGGQVPDQPMPLSTLAVDADTFVTTFPEHQLTQAEIDAWNRDHQAIVVGRGTAGKLGWKVGDRITIKQSLPPYSSLEFHVISLAEKGTDPITMWVRRDYVQEETRKAGMLLLDEWLSFIFLKTASKADLDHFPTAIDELFARTPDETKSQDEKTFMNAWITQQFDLPRNLAILSWVTVAVAVMASSNTMSMNFRDRLNELAILKSLGYSGWVFGLIQFESLVLCALGGLVGALAPYVALTYTALKDYPVPLIQHLDVKPVVCAQALVISLIIGVAAALWPSWLAWRMTVVAALRNLE